MAIMVQTLTLSPAFLQEIKEDDHQLRQLLDRLRQALQIRDWGESQLRQLAKVTAQLRDRLAFHFTLEESYGYFEDPVSVAPRLCEAAEDLRSEHGRLYSHIAQVADDADGCHHAADEMACGELRASCRKFVRCFEEHEARENELISRAFNEDIGECD